LPACEVIAPHLAAFGLFAALLTEAAAASTAAGPYQCWFYSTPQPLRNFTLEDRGYIDAAGVRGSVAVSGKKMRFKGGALDGRTGIYNDGSPPTISFYNADGEQVLLCQRRKTIKAKPRLKKQSSASERFSPLET